MRPPRAPSRYRPRRGGDDDARVPAAPRRGGAGGPSLDVLPGLAGDDAALIHDLLRTTPFRSARGIAWKHDGARVAWAASASGPGSIVPVGYNAGVVEVSDASCEGCHRDAGRPFETWYPNILAYGELWGNDDVFTWHPFVIDAFVDDAGRVVSFNHDNRAMRPDLIAAGLLAPYDPAVHDDPTYRRIHREWTDFAD